MYGYGQLHGGRLPTRRQLRREAPLAMTASKERTKGDGLPLADKKGRKRSLTRPGSPTPANRALCRDAQQENQGRTTPSAAAVEKSHHPTDLLGDCFCRWLLRTGKPCSLTVAARFHMIVSNSSNIFQVFLGFSTEAADG